jgi:hypothetical protein
MATRHQRERKAAQRAAHAARKDARRPKGSELLSVQRQRAKAARKQARRG